MSGATPRITVVGLGPGDPGLLTQQTIDLLRTGNVFLRTRVHPSVYSMPESNDWPSFDHLYESSDTFEGVCDAIVAELLKAASDTPIVYAVPGHPLFGEATVRHLIAAASESDVDLRLVPAVSFVDTVATTLQIDPLDRNLQIVDALDVATAFDSRPYSGGLLPISPLRPALIAQIQSDRIASAITHALMRIYPGDLEVTLVSANETSNESTKTFRLSELDRQSVDHLSSLYIPAIDPLDVNRVSEGLQRIVARLRAPAGCPWDQEQTHESLTRHMLEEAYEAIDAIERDAPSDLQEELGDVLLQVYLHAQIAEEAGDFAFEDVIETVSSKLVRRHPHVFGDRQISTAGEVVTAWDQIKQDERSGQDDKPQSLFASIPTSLPALSRAQTVLRRARSMALMSANQVAQPIETNDRGQEIACRLASIVFEADAAGIDAEQALRQWANMFIASSEQRIQNRDR